MQAVFRSQQQSHSRPSHLQTAYIRHTYMQMAVKHM
jgi:hypothetical protein